MGLLGANGDEVRATETLEMTEATQSFAFEGLAAKPVPSILRGFSAPVVLERETDAAERAFLLAHEGQCERSQARGDFAGGVAGLCRLWLSQDVDG